MSAVPLVSGSRPPIFEHGFWTLGFELCILHFGFWFWAVCDKRDNQTHVSNGVNVTENMFSACTCKSGTLHPDNLSGIRLVLFLVDHVPLRIMTKPGMVKEFVWIAVDYGKALYQYHESLELVKREKESLRIFRKWARKPQTRKVSAHALDSLRQEILSTQQHIWSDSSTCKYLRGEVTRLERALAAQTRKLVATE